jgi:ribose transport system permease protein
VILTGGIDLSVGAILAMSTVISALTLRSGLSAEVSSVATLTACAFVGFLNGVLVVFLKIPPFIATLAMLSIAKGTSYIIQSTTLIQISDQRFVKFFATGKFLGVPSPVMIFIVVTLIAWFVAKYTDLGRRLYALGGNPEAARLSGLPVQRDLILTYTVSGFLAGLAGAFFHPIQKPADGAVTFQRVAQACLPADLVAVSAPEFFTLENTHCFEICKNPLNSPLGDADGGSQVANA